MALEKEEALGAIASAHILKATAPIYPLLENAEHKNVLTDDGIRDRSQ